MEEQQIPWYDIDYMKSLLVPNPRKYKISRNKSNDLIRRRFIIYSKSNYSTLKSISSDYGVNVELREGTVDDPKGSFGLDTNTCYIRYIRGQSLNPYEAVKTFCHELSHGIQTIVVRGMYGPTANLEFQTLSSVLEYERAANKLGYEIYKHYFTDSTYKLKDFMANYPDEDWLYDWVLDYYSGLEDDIRKK